MAAPEGNNNKNKNKPWADALKRAMARYDGGKENALNLIADQTVKRAINGDRWAVEEIGNRVDGKPAQSVSVAGDEDSPLTFIQKVELVALKNANSAG